MEDLEQSRSDESEKAVRVWKTPLLIPLDLADAQNAGLENNVPDGIGTTS